MREKRRKYSPEFKSEAVRLVIDTSRPIVEVAREIGVHEGTLGAWVNKYRTEHAGDEPPLTLSERARLRELEREVRELRMKTEFLGKGAPRTREAARGRSRCRAWCCAEDEGVWPFGVARRGEASNHLMPRWLKTVVVSDEEKAP
jgi:transposase